MTVSFIGGSKKLATEDAVYLEFDEAVWLHFELMWAWDENHIGVDRRDLIESALARPKQAFHYSSADIVRQSATLCFGLVKNHPWRGGNKRTATHLMRVFLMLNGFELKYEVEEMVEMVLAVEANKWKVDEIEEWLRSRVAQV
jgi:death on curing protein